MTLLRWPFHSSDDEKCKCSRLEPHSSAKKKKSNSRIIKLERLRVNGISCCKKSLVYYNLELGTVFSRAVRPDSRDSLMTLSSSSSEFRVPTESSIDTEECSTPRKPACNIWIKFLTGVQASRPGKEISSSFHNNRTYNSGLDSV